MESLRNKHRDKLIIVAGAGPSLNNYTMKDIPTDAILICCNAAIIKFVHSNYWMAVDVGVLIQESVTEKHYLKADEVILTEEFHRRLSQLHQRINHPYITRLSRKYNLWEMDRNSKELVMGYDVVTSAVHLALIMGAKQIALIGCELNLDKGVKYFTPNPHVGINLFDTLHLSNQGWKEIAKHNKDLPIYNCAANSKMFGIPIKPLKDIISDF